MTKFSGFLLAGVAAIALFPAAKAMAEADGSAASQTAQAKEDQIEEVTVTARRVSENIQDVPISIQAVSGAQLEMTNTTDLQDLINMTPGLNSTGGNPRNFSVAIRGIGYAPTAADGLDNAIGVYFDGVYQARPGQVLQDLVDVDSFEILKGPQGTLFGRNAAAGALNVTTNAPSFTQSENFELSAGRFSYFQMKGIATGPLTDNVAYRTSVYGTFQDGWLPTPFAISFNHAASLEGIYAPTATNEQDTAGVGRYGGRQKFLINVSDKLSINLNADIESENDSSSGFSSGGGITSIFGPGNWGINTTAAQQATTTRALAALNNIRTYGGVENWIPSVNPTASISNSLALTKTTQGGVAATVDYNMDWASLTSISAFRFWHFNPPQDSDGSPLDIYDNEAITTSHQYSEELRLASNGKGPLEWQTGIFLYYSILHDHYEIHQFGADTVAWYDAYQGSAVIPTSFGPVLTGSQIIENTHVQDQNEAMYGQATYHILPDLDLTGGLRYTYDRKSGSSPVDTSHLPQTLPAGVSNTTLNTFYKAIGAIFENPGVLYTTPGYTSALATSGYPIGAATEAGKLSYTASVSYKITPDINIYATNTTGYQAGGLDLNNGSALAGATTINPTTTRNYEVGIKSALLDRHLTIDLAAYQETLDGFQTSISYTLPNGTSYRGATNAGNIRARGFEWDVESALGNGVRLTFSGNYNDSIYTYAPSLPAPAELSYNGVSTINAAGQTAPYAPKVSFAITPSWNYQIGAHEEFYTYVQYNYTGHISTGVTYSIYTQIPGESNVNARVGVTLDDAKYDVSLYANNALNAKNIANRGLLSAPSGAGVTAYLGTTVSYNPPAMYGITLKAKF